MRIAVMAAFASGLLAALVVGLPVLNRQLEAMIVRVGPLPTSSGKYKVGHISQDLPLVLDRRGIARNVSVGFWYPIEAGEHGSLARAPRHSLPPGASSDMANGDTPVSNHRAKWPLILYAPGWGGSKEDNALLIREFTSHGYVVAALDDIGVDAQALERIGSEIDAAASMGVDFTSPDAVAATHAVAERRMHLMVQKMVRLLDVLGGNGGAGLPRHIAERLELARVGVVGFSIGGAAAAEATLHDTRFVAAVNLDGWLAGKALEKRIEVPFLTFNSDFPKLDEWSRSKDLGKLTTALLTVSDRALQQEQSRNANSHMLFFRSVDHGDFTDSLFAPSIKAYFKRWSRTPQDRRRFWDFFSGYQVAFFGRYLRGDNGHIPILDDASLYSEVQRMGGLQK